MDLGFGEVWLNECYLARDWSFGRGLGKLRFTLLIKQLSKYPAPQDNFFLWVTEDSDVYMEGAVEFIAKYNENHYVSHEV